MFQLIRFQAPQDTFMIVPPNTNRSIMAQKARNIIINNIDYFNIQIFEVQNQKDIPKELFNDISWIDVEDPFYLLKEDKTVQEILDLQEMFQQLQEIPLEILQAEIDRRKEEKQS